MFPRKVSVFLASVVLFSQVSSAQQTAVPEDVAPPDAKTLSLQIKSFAAIREQQKENFFQNAQGQLNKTLQQSGSAGNYVLECMRQVRFKDVKGGSAEGAKWKKDNQKLYSNHDIETAASLHLHYLVMTLKRAGEETSEPMQQASWDYLAELFKSLDLLSDAKKDPMQVKFNVYDAKQGKVVNEMVGSMQGLQTGGAVPDNPRSYVDELLNNPVTGGWVAKTMNLDGQFGDLENWETSAGGFSGILDKNIRPYLRKKKDVRLLSTWDYEASFAGTIASKSLDGKVRTKFLQEDYPRLMWKKADDVEKLGMPNRALEIRVALAKNYPNHPDFESWTGEILSKLSTIKKAADEAKANDAEGVTPAAGAPPTAPPAAVVAPGK